MAALCHLNRDFNAKKVSSNQRYAVKTVIMKMYAERTFWLTLGLYVQELRGILNNHNFNENEKEFFFNVEFY